MGYGQRASGQARAAGLPSEWVHQSGHRPSVVAGTIAVLSSDIGRYSAFHHSMMELQKPAASALVWHSGGVNIARNRNDVVTESEGAWLWMIDDDHVFAPDTLSRLLRHLNDSRVDVVVPYCLRRVHPCEPVLFTFGSGHRPALMNVPPTARGLIEVDAAGTAGMLIRRRVFETLPRPWFEVGRFESDGLDEDLWFCKKARDAGFRIFCDLDVPIGHITPLAVWPVRGDDGYRLQWLSGPGETAAIVKRPAPLPKCEGQR